jgi:hypothetical protein
MLIEKPVLYKIIFPECGKLYVGYATSSLRYNSQKNINSNFTSKTHSNPDVKALLQSGEFAYILKVKEFDTELEAKKAEEKYLQRVWINEKPDWLLNKTKFNVWRFPSGDANPNKSDDAKARISFERKGKKIGYKPRSLRAREKKTGLPLEKIWVEVREALELSTSYHWGGAKIAAKYGISRRSIAKMSKAIRAGISPQEFFNAFS